MTRGFSRSLSVSPVSARDSFAIAQMSPAMTRSRSLELPERGRERADALVLVVVLVPAVMVAELGEVPGDVDGRVRVDGAREHPGQADPSDVRVGGRLDDLGDERAGRVAAEPVDGLAGGV